MKINFNDPNSLPSGIYHVSLSGKGIECRAIKRKGKWFFADGTGWEEPFLREQAFKVVRFYRKPS